MGFRFRLRSKQSYEINSSVIQQSLQIVAVNSPTVLATGMLATSIERNIINKK